MAVQPIRRRIRFSLRSLLLCVLLIGGAAMLYRNFAPWVLVTKISGVNAGTLSFSGDGKRLVTSTLRESRRPGEAENVDPTAQVWDVSTGERLAVLQGHSGQVNGAQFSRDGKYILSFSVDGIARLHDGRTYQPMPLVIPFENSFGGACLAPSGRWVATSSKNAMCRIYSVPDGKEVEAFATPSPNAGQFNFLAFNRDETLITGIYLFDDAQTYRCKGGERAATTPLKPSHIVGGTDGDWIYSKNETTIRISDAATGNTLFTLNDVAAPEMAASEDYQSLLTLTRTPTDDGYEPSDVVVWDVATRAPRHTFHLARPAWNVAFVPNSEKIAIAARDEIYIHERRRPEYWWGLAWLPEFWLTAVLAIAMVGSLRRDWREAR